MALEGVEDLRCKAVGVGVVALGSTLGGGASAGGVIAFFREELRAFGETVCVIATKASEAE